LSFIVLIDSHSFNQFLLRCEEYVFVALEDANGVITHQEEQIVLRKYLEDPNVLSQVSVDGHDFLLVGVHLDIALVLHEQMVVIEIIISVDVFLNLDGLVSRL